VAADLVEHFGDRLAAMDGKAAVLAMSRRIAADLYREIAARFRDPADPFRIEIVRDMGLRAPHSTFAARG